MDMTMADAYLIACGLATFGLSLYAGRVFRGAKRFARRKFRLTFASVVFGAIVLAMSVFIVRFFYLDLSRGYFRLICRTCDHGPHLDAAASPILATVYLGVITLPFVFLSSLLIGAFFVAILPFEYEA